MSEPWLWIERLSWVVAIIGIPSLVIGLLTMVRRPKIEVGFLPLRTTGPFFRRGPERPSKELDIKVSDRVPLRFLVANVGRATARDLLLNFRFPGLRVDQIFVPTGAPLPKQHPVHSHPFWAYHINHIHPGDRHYSDIDIRIPVGASVIEVAWEVSMADAPVARGTCQVKVS